MVYTNLEFKIPTTFKSSEEYITSDMVQRPSLAPSIKTFAIARRRVKCVSGPSGLVRSREASPVVITVRRPFTSGPPSPGPPCPGCGHNVSFMDFSCTYTSFIVVTTAH